MLHWAVLLKVNMKAMSDRSQSNYEKHWVRENVYVNVTYMAVVLKE
jgi:hypothetical protein